VTQTLTADDLIAIAAVVRAALLDVGGGAISKTLTIDDGTTALDGVFVWVTSDLIGASTVASGYTDSLGRVTFLLDAGTYYVWCQRAGMTATNPTTEVWS